MLARRRVVETAHAPWPRHSPAWPVGLGVVPPPRAGHATANQTNAGRPAAARKGLASGSKPGSGIWSSGVAAGGQWPAVAPINVGGGGRQAVSTSLLKGRAGTLAPPPPKAARTPKLAPTCRSRRPHHASRPMAQATQEYNIVIHFSIAMLNYQRVHPLSHVRHVHLCPISVWFLDARAGPNPSFAARV